MTRLIFGGKWGNPVTPGATVPGGLPANKSGCSKLASATDPSPVADWFRKQRRLRRMWSVIVNSAGEPGVVRRGILRPFKSRKQIHPRRNGTHLSQLFLAVFSVPHLKFIG